MGWIVGVVLSSVLPVFDIICVIIYFIIKIMPNDFDNNNMSVLIDWEFFWFLFALTCLSLISLVILIVYRVKKKKQPTVNSTLH